MLWVQIGRHNPREPGYSKERLLCAITWVIEQVEAHCAEAGWSTARHVQAPTTDVPVSQVAAIRGWFDEVLREKLFPMLAARYPYAIGSGHAISIGLAAIGRPISST